MEHYTRGDLIKLIGFYQTPTRRKISAIERGMLTTEDHLALGRDMRRALQRLSRDPEQARYVASIQSLADRATATADIRISVLLAIALAVEDRVRPGSHERIAKRVSSRSHSFVPFCRRRTSKP